MRGGAADIESRRFKDAGIPAEIVFRSEIDVDGNTGGRTSRDEKGFRKFDAAFSLRFPTLRGKIAVEIEKAAESRGRVEKTGGGKVQGSDIELGIERSERRVRFIHGAERAVQLEFSAGGQIGGDRNGKFRDQRNIGSGNVHV